ncbi:hypothetical protein MNBD_GAMMA16-842 [hydrothermal vent metagenome]|uniref:Phosphohistidine phosphatase SixA n=1 Tax=hydrothermal vent metagenome TaxID=652676 RepID=A0A3B1A0H1_9ZZZZ
MSKHLYLLRHGNSPFGEFSDKERVLSEQGCRDVLTISAQLKKKGIRPDLICCSTAQRTRQTAQHLTESWAVRSDLIQYDERLYNASLESLIYFVREFNDNINSVLIIGHNPGLSELVQFGDGESYCQEHGFTGLTTSSFAHLELIVPWSKFNMGQSRVLELLNRE